MRGEEPGGRAATEINRGLGSVIRVVRLEPDVRVSQPLRATPGLRVRVRRADGGEVMGERGSSARLVYAQVLMGPAQRAPRGDVPQARRRGARAPSRTMGWAAASLSGQDLGLP